MTTSETMTIRLAPKDKALLTRLAQTTRRSKSFLAAEAIHAFVTREASLMAHLREGLEDMKTGKLVSNDKAYQSWMKAIGKAERSKP